MTKGLKHNDINKTDEILPIRLLCKSCSIYLSHFLFVQQFLTVNTISKSAGYFAALF